MCEEAARRAPELALAVGDRVIADRAVLRRDLCARDGSYQAVDDDAVGLAPGRT